MNLTTCISCGVVLDKDHLTTDDIYNDDGIDMDKALYDHDTHSYYRSAPCPVCKAPIPMEEI